LSRLLIVDDNDDVAAAVVYDDVDGLIRSQYLIPSPNIIRVIK